MSRLSPCPQCRGERVWARAALGVDAVSLVAFCPGCARAAVICPRCGTELVLTRQSSSTTPGPPRMQSVVHCPLCRQEMGTQTAQTRSVAAAPGATREVAAWSAATAGPAAVRRSAVTRFLTGSPAPVVMQRAADDRESQAAIRCVRQLQLIGLVEQAARRADAMARLEVELSHLDTLAEG